VTNFTPSAHAPATEATRNITSNNTAAVFFIRFPSCSLIFPYDQYSQAGTEKPLVKGGKYQK
jgi:hypothetical protein